MRCGQRAGDAHGCLANARHARAGSGLVDVRLALQDRREFFGEGERWADLVRTQKWNEYADTYVICGKKGDRNAQTYTRTINPGHYLRPIPQGQIDGMEMSDEEKKNYQNPEYR